MPQRQGGRRAVRRRCEAGSECDERRARRDKAAADRQALAHGHRHRRDRAGCGGGGRRCDCAHQHGARHGDRRRDEKAEDGQRRRGAVRPGDQADRAAPGVAGLSGGQGADRRDGRHHERG